MVSGDATEQVAAADPGFDAFLRQALSEIGAGAGIGSEDIEARLDPAAPRKTGPQNWWWVRTLARAIDDRLTPMADFTIEAFLRDVYCYLRKPEVAKAIDAIVDAELRDAPTVVIGHSLGSVVAYRLLQRRRALRPLGFVTLGSPLGLRAIAGALGVPENPVGRDGWFNAYDPRDIVALNPLDDAHFPAVPGVVNHGGVDNPTANRHGIVGYLDDMQVARQVAAFARAAGA
jgi:pimeloyl-ACP methyl ester carboxylesterase